MANVISQRCILLKISIWFLGLISVSISSELDILLKFKASLEASDGHVFGSWKTNISVCNFTGILCNSNGMVKEIDLCWNRLSGKIPEAIGQLKMLNSLRLEGNKFSGSIPQSLASCASLFDLNLAHNRLSGKIPKKLGSLPNLKYLNLSGNMLSGEIPSSSCVQYFDVSNNRLTGPIPPQCQNAERVAGNPGLCQSHSQFYQFSSTPRCPSPSSLLRKIFIFISCILVGPIILFVCVLFNKLRLKYCVTPFKEQTWVLVPFCALNFTEREILNGIKHENLIGKGGSGDVYRVVLGNGEEFAVKRKWYSTSSQGRRRPLLPRHQNCSPEYDAEAETLSSMRHVNLVKIFCSITSEDTCILVYEYLHNGSLWERLHTGGELALQWDKRYEIALGIAKGLDYLHHGCETPMMHRDVKSSNILLDMDLKTRIADFGLAKFMQANAAEDSTHTIVGTLGYLAPEYAYTSQVNEKSDVFSFGVVLMELVTGKKPFEPEFGENKDIVYWTFSKMTRKDHALTAVDSRISESFKENALKVLHIAVLCTANTPSKRPSMKVVLRMLEDAEPFKN